MNFFIFYFLDSNPHEIYFSDFFWVLGFQSLNWTQAGPKVIDLDDSIMEEKKEQRQNEGKKKKEREG